MSVELDPEQIIEYYLNLKNFKLENITPNCTYFNSSCGDQGAYSFEVINNKIINLKFKASGCVMSKVSSAILAELLYNMKLDDFSEIYQKFLIYITSGQMHNKLSSYEGMRIFTDLYKFPARRQCVFLPWESVNTYFNTLD